MEFPPLALQGFKQEMSTNASMLIGQEITLTWHVYWMDNADSCATDNKKNAGVLWKQRMVFGENNEPRPEGSDHQVGKQALVTT